MKTAGSTHSTPEPDLGKGKSPLKRLHPDGHPGPARLTPLFEMGKLDKGEVLLERLKLPSREGGVFGQGKVLEDSLPTRHQAPCRADKICQESRNLSGSLSIDPEPYPKTGFSRVGIWRC